MKSIKYLAAAALALLAVGCNKESVTEVPDGQMVDVTFTAALPGEMATKAIGDGTTAKNLYVSVYENDEAKTQLESLKKKALFTNLKTTVDFSLVKGKTYNFVFWAQAENAPYDISDLKNVKMNYGSASANDETRDAFYAVTTLKVTGPLTETVKLYRPFAQVNFGTLDFTFAKDAGFEPALSSFTADAIASTFDTFNAEGKDEVTLTLTEKDIPTEELKATGASYKWLAMNYVLPMGKQAEKHNSNVSATFKSNSESVTISAPNAPIQANYRTNILGNLLTNQTTFNVEIIPAFKTPDNDIQVVSVSGADGMASVVANGSFTDENLDINLNGESFASGDADKKATISAKSVFISNGKVNDSGLSISAEDGITLKDIDFVGSFSKSNSNARINLNTSGPIVVDGIDFTGATDGYNCLEINLNETELPKSVTIRNCKFSGNSNNSLSIFGMPEDGVVNIEKCEFSLSDNGEAVRISNKTNSKRFTVNVSDCNYTYPENATPGEWKGFFLFQDYTSTTEDISAGRKQFSGLTINCRNVTFKGEKVTELNLNTNKVEQFACMYYDRMVGGVVTDATHFPTFNFID